MHITTSDVELLRLMMGGDEEAFTELYRRRQGSVYRFALQMTGSATIAEDMTQDVFVALMRDGRNFNPERGSLAAYLYGIARNVVLRRWERERIYEPIVADNGNGNAPSYEQMAAASDPLEDLSRSETIETVRRAVLALPAHYREAVVLCDLHELSYAEAAEALECSIGTVRSRLHRGRAMLVERLGRTGRKESALQDSAADDSAPEAPAPAVNRARCLV